MPAEIITINQEVNSLGDVCSTTDVTSGVEKPSATSIDTRVSDTAMLQVTAAHSVGDDCVATSSRPDEMSKACVMSISESDVDRLTPATTNSQLTAPSNIIATTSSLFEQTAGAPAAHNLPFVPDRVITGILAKGAGATSSHLVARRGKPMPVAAGLLIGGQVGTGNTQGPRSNTAPPLPLARQARASRMARGGRSPTHLPGLPILHFQWFPTASTLLDRTAANRHLVPLSLLPQPRRFRMGLLLLLERVDRDIRRAFRVPPTASLVASTTTFRAADYLLSLRSPRCLRNAKGVVPLSRSPSNRRSASQG